MEATRQLRGWSTHRWKVVGQVFLIAFLAMGVVGETLPLASIGREVPVEWWNYVTLVLSPLLIALIAATFIDAAGTRVERTRGAKMGAGLGGTIGMIAMACPACSPLAIPLFGAAGVLSFLAPERWLIALLSVAMLGLTLVLRLRAERSCQIRFPAEDTAAERGAEV